jgi:hypothetical protein
MNCAIIIQNTTAFSWSQPLQLVSTAAASLNRCS